MKKISIIIPFLVLLVYLRWYVTVQRPAPIYLSNTNQISPPKNSQYFNKVKEIIKVINDRNSKIKSISVEKMPITLQQNGHIFNATGNLALQKENNFRLMISHKLFGEMMDIGSNKQYFWFWSKQMKPAALYYSKHEDTNKTMLKTALNPDWMIQSLNINLISEDDIKIAKFKEFGAVIEDKTATTGDPVTIMTLIDMNLKIVVGRYLYNQNEKIIASAEYSEFVEKIPRKILIIWYEEGVILNWDLSKVKINSDIDQRNWSMPDMKNKINMGN